MKKLSVKKLATTTKEGRINKEITQEQLSELTGINRVMIGRIERNEFIPSISQLEALAKVLDFEITDMFMDAPNNNSFVAMRCQASSDLEKEGLDKLFSLMLSLRQQILLRSKFESKLKLKSI